ncbi:hypothetical protein KSF_102990 [Reticulibacter mediterranei]|uniref:Enoyl reductase (ER) domain-containing protein n=1 Tax=Reticulibacter mediterranei TaxID=2778369 RepID=A0A8J3J3V3_9CHLR|nr:zinc-binding dehydrogenase [Reticulibacter mediterranei]GHP00252.1 hypothetical protein KSF_102990 [Reticulibacter mediterranei]
MSTYQGRSWQAETFGSPQEVLRLKNVTWQPPTKGQLLVKAHACEVGLPDLLTTEGKFPLLTAPPAIPGQEVAGSVVSVPQGSVFSVGDRVMGITPFQEAWGGYSDYAYVREASTRPIPSTLSDEEAAGFLIGFKTAYNALTDRISVTADSVVLVLGAAGSSGGATIQLAKALGTTVIAVTSSEEKVAFCTRIGADHVVNRMTSNFVDEVHKLTDGRGVDIIFDPEGMKQFRVQERETGRLHLLLGTVMVGIVLSVLLEGIVQLLPPHYILGWGISGEVVALGEGVTQFMPGDEVYGMLRFPQEGKAYIVSMSAPQSQILRLSQLV